MERALHLERHLEAYDCTYWSQGREDDKQPEAPVSLKDAEGPKIACCGFWAISRAALSTGGALIWLSVVLPFPIDSLRYLGLILEV